MFRAWKTEKNKWRKESEKKSNKKQKHEKASPNVRRKNPDGKKSTRKVPSTFTYNLVWLAHIFITSIPRPGSRGGGQGGHGPGPPTTTTGPGAPHHHHRPPEAGGEPKKIMGKNVIWALPMIDFWWGALS